MKKLALFIVVMFAFIAVASAQIRFVETFESSDSANLPTGWSKWNQAPFAINPESHWLVQEVGLPVIGLGSSWQTVSHDSLKAARVSWVSGVDTGTRTNGIADAWLVTKRIPGIAAADSLVFWAIGGNGGTTGTYYRDTLEISVGTIDSLPTNITMQLDTITWRNDSSTYGIFKRYALALGAVAGNDIFVAFRYHTNVLVAGFVVFLDDVVVRGPLTSVEQISATPSQAILSQNYPNPFNPSTTIAWSVPARARVSITVFNMLGQEIETLVDAEMEAGQFKTTWNASAFPSGVYFYRMKIGTSTHTRKMVYVR